MRSRTALRLLAEVTESQWGMVTSAQATARGIDHVTLARLSESGDLERLAHGVYKDAGAPSDEFQDLRAAWLTIEPAIEAWERLRAKPSFATVSGESAATLHDVGNLRAMRSEFTTLKRKQTQRDDVRYRTRILEAEDVTVQHGLPVTTIERTIADLIESRNQLEHVGHVLRDAMRKTDIDTQRLVHLLSPLAERNGHRKWDGHSLLQQILESAQLDQGSIVRQIVSAPGLAALVTAQFFTKLPSLDMSSINGSAINALEAAGVFKQSQEIGRRIMENSGAFDSMARVQKQVTAEMKLLNNIQLPTQDFSAFLNLEK